MKALLKTIPVLVLLFLPATSHAHLSSFLANPDTTVVLVVIGTILALIAVAAYFNQDIRSIVWPLPRFRKELGQHYAEVIMVLWAALVIQSFHVLEHAVEVYQYLGLGIHPSEAHALLAFADNEWNHFADGWIYWFILLITFAVMVADRKLRAFKYSSLGKCLLGTYVLGLGIQFYHMVENTMQLGKFLAIDCDPCTGFFGFFFDPTVLHLWFNALAMLPLLITYHLYKAYKKIHSEPPSGM